MAGLSNWSPAMYVTLPATSIQFYDWAVHLIKEGKAYVDHQDAETMARENRGNFNKPGGCQPKTAAKVL